MKMVKSLIAVLMVFVAGTGVSLMASSLIPGNEVHWLSNNEGFQVFHVVGDSPPAKVTFNLEGEWISKNHQDATECLVEVWVYLDGAQTATYISSLVGSLDEYLIDDSGWKYGTWKVDLEFWENGENVPGSNHNLYFWIYGDLIVLKPKVKFGYEPNHSWVYATDGTWGTASDWIGIYGPN